MKLTLKRIAAAAAIAGITILAVGCGAETAPPPPPGATAGPYGAPGYPPGFAPYGSTCLGTMPIGSYPNPYTGYANGQCPSMCYYSGGQCVFLGTSNGVCQIGQPCYPTGFSYTTGVPSGWNWSYNYGGWVVNGPTAPVLPNNNYVYYPIYGTYGATTATSYVVYYAPTNYAQYSLSTRSFFNGYVWVSLGSSFNGYYLQ